jgi:predicted glycoside hydrolase/deacetylase ChbG (UPF0249 family)
VSHGKACLVVPPRGIPAPAGLLIVNADDWGRDRLTTDRTLDCVRREAISSVSAMVFMEDSGRAAAIAKQERIEVGLHLNLTTPFSDAGCPDRLVQRQQQVARYLRSHRLSQAIFHPGLTRAFDYIVAAELDEFRRLYGADPDRLDGHHHMHLCANVLLAGLLPRGTMVRRSFSFQVGEKKLGNVVYRRLVDLVLARRHRLADFFFSLAPLAPSSRLQRIVELARRFVVEVETHPADPDEYQFLTGGDLLSWIGDVPIMPPSTAARRGQLSRGWPSDSGAIRR